VRNLIRKLETVTETVIVTEALSKPQIEDVREDIEESLYAALVQVCRTKKIDISKDEAQNVLSVAVTALCKKALTMK
jgi:hypothetical protein